MHSLNPCAKCSLIPWHVDSEWNSDSKSVRFIVWQRPKIIWISDTIQSNPIHLGYIEAVLFTRLGSRQGSSKRRKYLPDMLHTLERSHVILKQTLEWDFHAKRMHHHQHYHHLCSVLFSVFLLVKWLHQTSISALARFLKLMLITLRSVLDVWMLFFTWQWHQWGHQVTQKTRTSTEQGSCIEEHGFVSGDKTTKNNGGSGMSVLL